MKRTFFDIERNGLTAIPTSQRYEVLFFANAHCTYLSLLTNTQTDPKSKDKCMQSPNALTNTNKTHFNMKKSIFLIIFLFFGITVQSFGQGHYKTKFSKGKGEFLIPPDTYWGYKEDGKKKCVHDRYYYIEFFGLTKDYLNTIEELYFTDYWSDNIDYFKEKKQPKHKNILLNKKIKQQGAILEEIKSIKSEVSNKSFQCSPMDDKNSVYFIQIDYNALMNGDRQQIISNFFQFAKELLVEISGKEGAYSWPTSISQNLVEKIFELIPIPSEASLSRYISQIDSAKSFVLLNPKIKLKVDAVEKVKDGSNWYFNLLGTTTVTINRDNEGRIIQNPFHKFQVKGMPDNTAVHNTDGNPDIIHQASTEDIQLSETLRDKPYIFLYQNGFKANSVTSLNKVCDNTSNDRFDCNSMLVHYSDLSKFFNDRKNDLSLANAKYISSFGFRNLITPTFDILVNGCLIQCPLGLSLNQLRNQMAMPLSFKIYRFWNGRYIKIKNINADNLILLPNDKIVF